jgi:type II secretion system protein G
VKPFYHSKAFTLVELLVVVGIIAILAAIAIPNFLEAQTRAKVARAKNDLRVIAMALESFHTDNHRYPEIIPPPELIDSGGALLLQPLTTPVAYLRSLPADPFLPPLHPEPLMPPAGRKTYRYTSYPVPPDLAKVWSLASNGPDLLNNTLSVYEGYSASVFAGPITLYDPTNGTISRGDIFRAQDFTPN